MSISANEPCLNIRRYWNLREQFWELTGDEFFFLFVVSISGLDRTHTSIPGRKRQEQSEIVAFRDLNRRFGIGIFSSTTFSPSITCIVIIPSLILSRSTGCHDPHKYASKASQEQSQKMRQLSSFHRNIYMHFKFTSKASSLDEKLIKLQ